MKLYYSPGSCAQASHIALCEAGASFEIEALRLDKAEQRTPEHLARNPLGRVPVLETEHGFLTENPAILAYVAQAFPEAKLAPADPFELARMYSFNAYIASTVHPHYAHYFRPGRWSDDEAGQATIKAKAPGNVDEAFRLIDATKIDGPWVLGDQYTTADCYLFVMTRWLARPGIDLDVAAYPRVAEHFSRMKARPAVRKAVEAEGLTL